MCQWLFPAHGPNILILIKQLEIVAQLNQRVPWAVHLHPSIRQKPLHDHLPLCQKMVHLLEGAGLVVLTSPSLKSVSVCGVW